jgi:Ca-activated chloride channel family protein
MSSRDTEQPIDDLLRDVPQPAHLLPRLRGIAALSDQELDFRLRDVQLPGGLPDRLKAAVPDMKIEEQICDVAIPAVVMSRARSVAVGRGRRLAGQLALAATVMFALGVTYLSAMTGMLMSLRPTAQQPPAIVVVDRGPLRVVSPPDEGVVIDANLMEMEEEQKDPLPVLSEPSSPFTHFSTAVPKGPAGQLLAEIPHQWDPWDNWLVMRWGLLGYGHRDDRPPVQMQTMSPPLASGMEAPLTRHYDREFLFSRAAHPPVFTSGDRSLCRLSPPLTTRDDSFASLRSLVGKGRLPAPPQICVEDFLAAMRYDFPAARPGRLALCAAGGPSRFSPFGAALLQLGVTAGPANQARKPTHVTVALDTSTSMAWDGKLDMARQALEAFLRHLGPEDRFSMLLLGDEIVHAVEGARRDEADSVVLLLDRLTAHGGTDLGSGLQQAIAAAMETDAKGPYQKRLVLLTDSQNGLSGDAVGTIQGMLDTAKDSGLLLNVMDLSHGTDEDAHLSGLCAGTRGQFRRVRSTNELRWALVETLTGKSSLVATEVRLHIDFNPKAVAAYRLIGHEATGMGGMMPAAVEADLHTGQEACVLLEMWLHHNDEYNVATARLTWTDADSGQSRATAPHRISRSQFASSFHNAPPPLQAAAIAAEAGEVMRRSFNFRAETRGLYRYSPKPRDLKEVLKAAKNVPPELASRCSFRRYISVLEQASHLSLDSPIGLTRAGQRGLVGGRWREL